MTSFTRFCDLPDDASGPVEEAGGYGRVSLGKGC